MQNEREKNKKKSTTHRPKVWRTANERELAKRFYLYYCLYYVIICVHKMIQTNLSNRF